MPCTVLEDAVHRFQGCSSDSSTISGVLEICFGTSIALRGSGGLFFILQERISILEMVEFGWSANPNIIVCAERARYSASVFICAPVLVFPEDCTCLGSQALTRLTPLFPSDLVVLSTSLQLHVCLCHSN